MYKTWFKDPPWIGANLFASLECSKTATKIYLVDDIIQFVLMSYFPTTTKKNLRLHNKRGRLSTASHNCECPQWAKNIP